MTFAKIFFDGVPKQFNMFIFQRFIYLLQQTIFFFVNTYLLSLLSHFFRGETVIKNFVVDENCITRMQFVCFFEPKTSKV